MIAAVEGIPHPGGRSSELAGRVHREDGKASVWLGRFSARALFDRMKAAEIDTLHVHASALPWLGLPAELEVPLPGERAPAHPFMLDTGRASLAPCTEYDGAEITIGAYQDGAGDPFAEAVDAHELVAAHVAFRDAFPGRGWAFKHTAISTGWKLMHAQWERGRRKAQVAALDEPEELLLDGVEPGSQVEVPYGGKWAIDHMAAEASSLPNVLAWDVNGQRLAACSKLRCGIGEPERHNEPTDLKLPGYHLVTAIEHPFPGLIPPIFELGWHTTPRVAMARYLGIAFEIGESVVWPEHVAYLDPWYQQMRDARLALQATIYAEGERAPAAALALGALKQSYLQPLGRLRSHKLQGTKLYRPSWYDAVIGAELAREYLRLHQLAQANVPVLAVYFDTIIIESESDDLDAGAPGAIEVSDQLGKYKPVGKLPADQAHAALYTERGPDVGALVKAIKRGAAPSASEITAPRDSAYTRPSHGGYPTPAKEQR